MTERDKRRPVAFRLDDPGVVLTDGTGDHVSLNGRSVRVSPEAEPPPSVPATIDAVLPPERKGFGWGALFWSALGGLASLGVGLGVTHLIEDLFARSTSLGYIGAALAALTLLAVLVVAGREIFGLLRLATIEKLHARAAATLVSDDRDDARDIARELIALTKTNPALAHGRQTLVAHVDDIIDGADLVRLAERELMSPLDAEARNLISKAAQSVSVVTAISPRALIDILFVFISCLRLIRRLARLYGGRPGALGMMRLFRQVLSHLAITGGMAATDSLVQQALGQGIAAKLSSRLGEGVLNGFLTARLGLAALDVTRPLPFAALPRPAISDLIQDVVRSKPV
jgi:putative membrane protein